MSQVNLPVPVSNNHQVDESMIKKTIINIFNVNNNKTVYLKELMSKYNNIIDKNLTRDFEDILQQYIYNKRHNYEYIKTLLNQYIVSSISTTDEQYIENSLDAILKRHRDLYFKNIECELLNIQTNSINQSDSDAQQIKYIKEITNNYINYLIKNNQISNNNKYQILFERYNYFQYYITSIIDEIDFGGITYKQMITLYKKRKKEGFTSKYDDTYLHELVLQKKSRIMELYREKLSYNKIQKILTQECIDEKLIPPTMKRYSREKNVNNKIIESPTKLPLTGIKKVITEELSKNVIGDIEIID